MKNERDRNRKDQDQDQDTAATFTGEASGRGGDSIVQDDVVYGRATSNRDHAERERARAEKGVEEPDKDKHE
jgi:hypothetical protein